VEAVSQSEEDESMKLVDKIHKENAEIRTKISEIRHLKHLKKTNRELKKKLRGLN